MSTTATVVKLYNYTSAGDTVNAAANGLLDTVRIEFNPTAHNDTVVKLIDPVFGLELLTIQKAAFSLAPVIVKPRQVEHDTTGAVIPGSHTLHALSSQLVLVVVPAPSETITTDALATVTFSVIGD